MQPTFFINHGGGPCFFLDPGPMRKAWTELEQYLLGFAETLEEQPRAILVISGHWEEARPTVNAGATPPLLFDYGGFPEHTYQLTWPAPGDPALAARVRDLLCRAGIESGADERRGWDHGVFVPLKVMFPEADIPTVQLSLKQGLDPEAHLAIGRALAPLRGEGVLIVGSGQSYHNMRGFMGGSGRADPDAQAFDAWLREAMADGNTRDRSLIAWEQAPGARQAQPREDHLLPLMVAAGAASGEPGRTAFHGHALGKPISGFRFG
ncbi:DODA-type extradiol aromatic ring-opening family dioxygenase [Sphingomonas desiccabilis]|uniref:Dioxygenase n=1 Tax=Sphingomonas desiccabilis TaxID=429134 RepID=A0A4Q2IL17_9SPHN|nr:class III extradiol ring-cleavage dioxygenase [Sphingomonas desiccabilis]MBB3912534.1 aromatic ring-opening dioxygenase catalytic subunit (LigB family) [Sphingomonas desiccabilis]RXZ29961.1 dioxygenase [Sphingomonas desiccabilis]